LQARERPLHRFLARPDGGFSNELLETLAEWNTFLEHRKSHDLSVPPCP